MAKWLELAEQYGPMTNLYVYIYISYIELKYDSKAYHLPPIVAPIHLCNCHNSMAEKPDSILIETRTKFQELNLFSFAGWPLNRQSLIESGQLNFHQ